MLGVWEQKEMQDICHYSKTHSEGNRFIGVEDLHQEFAGVNFDKNRRGNGITYQQGDTLMSNIRPYLKKTWLADCDGVCSSDVLVFSPDTVAPDYLHRIISSEHFVSSVMSAAKGSKMPRGDKYQMMKMKVMIPSLSEQRKIGSFFNHLDGLIHLHQRQTQKLTELKQGLLHEMFPREGESVPRLRFPGFTTHWKQKQFNDVYTSFPNKMYQVQTSEYHAEGKFIVIDQGTNDIAGYTNREDKVCHQFPCIIFGDHTTNIKYVNEPFVVGADGVKTLKATGDCAFASYNLKVNNVTQQGYKRHFSQLKEINVLCPSPAEQQKIGSFFHTLDDLIHLHEQYTVKLTHLKKGLLQKMFPQD